MAAGSPSLAVARQHLAAGRTEQARAVLQRILQTSPRDVNACRMMGGLLAGQGQMPQAAFFYERALGVVPDDPDTLIDWAAALRRVGDLAQAESLALRAHRKDPAHLAAGTTLAAILAQQGRFADSLAVARALYAAGGRDWRAAPTLAYALTQLGRAAESVDVLRHAVAAAPGQLDVLRELPVAVNYDPRTTTREAFEVHKAFGSAMQQAVAAAGLPVGPAKRPTPADADRPLRVGIVSPDLRTHSISYFLEPLMSGLDRREFSIHAYHTGKVEDATSERLRGLASAWRSMTPGDNTGLARQVRADVIDVLIELAGHFAGNSLGAMALRPAPLQLTYLGYPNTTGLTAIDARIVDRLSDPPGADALATERLVRLDPCFLCYAPPADAPGVERRPADGPIRFGSFNAMQKLNDRVLRLWARVLDAVPGSRLTLKNRVMWKPDCRADVRARLTDAGIAAERVTLLEPIVGRDDHLGAYGSIDIALDTVPYAGTTTTCEAMLMGVPVVTRAGDAHVSRVGVSLLTAVGLTDLIAADDDEYVRIAASLAADGPRLAALRGSLRERLLASPLCDAAGFASRFGGAVRSLWRETCARGAGAGA